MNSSIYISAILALGFNISALNAQPSYPPPPPGGGGSGEPINEIEEPYEECWEDECDDFEEFPIDEVEESANPLDGLLAAAESMYEFTAENCNSKKDQIKYAKFINDLKRVLAKMARLNGMDSTLGLTEVLDSLGEIKSELKTLCLNEEELE